MFWQVCLMCSQNYDTVNALVSDISVAYLDIRVWYISTTQMYFITSWITPCRHFFYLNGFSNVLKHGQIQRYICVLSSRSGTCSKKWLNPSPFIQPWIRSFWTRPCVLLTSNVIVRLSYRSPATTLISLWPCLVRPLVLLVLRWNPA